MQNTKAILINIVVGVGTAVILSTLAFVGGVFKTGIDANNEDEIERVVESLLKTDSGKAFKARQAEINIELATMETRVSILTKDVDDLEDILFDLTID